MIPDHNSQPISLRLPYVFYQGHLPAFADLQISNYLREPLTEPIEYAKMFERGIDPDVQTREIHHSHSKGIFMLLKQYWINGLIYNLS